jgi:hypothetical protein
MAIIKRFASLIIPHTGAKSSLESCKFNLIWKLIDV